MKRILLSLALIGLTSLGFAQKKVDYTTIPSLVKAAKEKGNIKLADFLAQDYINNYLFKLKKEELFAKDNLKFMAGNLGNNKACQLFFKQADKVNDVLGEGMAQQTLFTFISNTYLPKDLTLNISPEEWNALEKRVVAKYGQTGQEAVDVTRMVYSQNKKNWKEYGVYFVKYFRNALTHPVIYANNYCWIVFEQVNDSAVLTFTCDTVMKYAMERWYQNDWQSYDTYANLLYKTGRREKALEWEEKALKLSNNDKGIVETLEKMKNNVATWIATANNP